MAVAVLVWLTRAILRRKAKYARFPPGPPSLPILGNIFDFPQKHLGREFAEMTRKYGDVVYLNLLGQDAIFLGSLTAARDLLDKRSANYSDRPASVMVKLTEYDWLAALMNYGPRWRQHRRAMHTTMSPDVVPQYEVTQINAARGLLQSLLRSPQDLASHIKFTVTAIFMETSYGIEIRERDDKYYHMLERMAEIGEAILLPGKFPVESFPLLRYLPAWFPGGGYKRWAEEAKRDLAYIVRYLFDSAKAADQTDDLSRRSAVSRILDNPKLAQEGQPTDLERLGKEVAATLYVGGADTLTIALQAFFQAMALYPEAQKKAQVELDAVVGAERLPEFSDRPSLPYIEALTKELLRWHSGTPIGFPHCVVADDEYNGHFIPAGATVFVNMWAILRDPEVYPKPDAFIPERFLDSVGNLDVSGRDPADIMFGFGRRVCVGRYFAESTLFILYASILSAFEIGPPIGEDGVPLKVTEWDATHNQVISHPKVHKYSITPRLPNVERLVESAAPGR